MKNGTYRALIGELVADLRVEDDRLVLDDTPRSYDFQRIHDGYYSLLIDGQSVPVAVQPLAEDRFRVTVRGHATEVTVQDENDLLLERYGLEQAAGPAEREIRAPMPGLVLHIMVEAGQSVREGDGLLVLEAMKMENELRAPAAGVVDAIHVAANDPVDKDALLIEIDTDG